MSIPGGFTLTDSISKFDVFKNMSVGLGQDDLAVETAENNGKIELKCVKYDFKSADVSAQNSSAVRKELKDSIDELLGRLESKFYLDGCEGREDETTQEATLTDNMDALKRLVNEKLAVATSESNKKVLTTSELSKVVVEVESLWTKLRGLKADEFLKLNAGDLAKLVEDTISMPTAGNPQVEIDLSGALGKLATAEVGDIDASAGAFKQLFANAQENGVDCEVVLDKFGVKGFVVGDDGSLTARRPICSKPDEIWAAGARADYKKLLEELSKPQSDLIRELKTTYPRSELAKAVVNFDEALSAKIKQRAETEKKIAALQKQIGGIDPSKVDKQKLFNGIFTGFYGKVFLEKASLKADRKNIHALIDGKSANELLELLKDAEVVKKYKLNADYVKARLFHLTLNDELGSGYDANEPFDKRVQHVFFHDNNHRVLDFGREFALRYPSLSVPQKNVKTAESENVDQPNPQPKVYSTADMLDDLKKLIADYERDSFPHGKFGVKRPELDMAKMVEDFVKEMQ